MCPSFPELSCDGNLQPIQIWRLSGSICVDLTTSFTPTSGPILIVVFIYVAMTSNFSIYELGDFEKHRIQQPNLERLALFSVLHNSNPHGARRMSSRILVI